MEYKDRWNLCSKKGPNFHPSNPRQCDVPPVFTSIVRNMATSDVCDIIKMLASFMSRRNITGGSVKYVARALYDELRVERNPHLGESYGTLKVLAEMSPDLRDAYGNLYEYLYQFISISIHDIETGNPRHKCDRSQCELYCILPIFANRCMSDSKVTALFQGLKSILIENPSLISKDLAETAQKLLKFLAYSGDDSLEDSYDVLYAMSGHSLIILDSAAFVDSRLYELLFDHLLLYYPDTQSFRPLMETYASQQLSDDVANLRGQDPQRYVSSTEAESDDYGAWIHSELAESESVDGTAIPGATGGATDAGAPPSYDSVKKQSDDDDFQLPTYEEAVIGEAQKITKQTTV